MALELTKRVAGEQWNIAKGSARAFADGARIKSKHLDKVRKYLSWKGIRKLPRDIKNKIRTRKAKNKKGWIWPIDGKCPGAQEGGRRRYRRRRRRRRRYRRRRTRRKRGGRRGTRFYRRRRTRRR